MIPDAPFTSLASPKVSVAMITYNHSRYITEAVDSVLCQRTNFPYEVVIGDDCSTDGTQEILQGLQRLYPERIRLLLHEINLGHLGKLNLASVLSSCRGEFVAFLEGDDLWGNSGKLQMQVDHLDLHPENSACFHSMWVIDQAGQRHLNKLRHPEKIAQVDIDKLLKIGFPNISTIMMRRALLSSYPEWFLDVATGDWTTAILCAKQGPLAYFRDIPMSIHRDRSKSCWLNRSLFERNLDEIHALETFDRYLQGEGHHGVIQQQINICEFWWVEIYYQLGQQIKARKAFWVAVHHWWRYRGVTVPQLLWYFLRAYFFGSVRLRARSQ